MYLSIKSKSAKKQNCHKLNSSILFIMSWVTVKVEINIKTQVKYRYSQNLIKYSNKVLVLRHFTPLLLDVGSTLNSSLREVSFLSPQTKILITFIIDPQTPPPLFLVMWCNIVDIYLKVTYYTHIQVHTFSLCDHLKGFYTL